MKQGWEYKKIGNICNITTGKLDANAANEDGLYPFFTCSRIPLSINTYAYDCECILIAGNGDLNVKYYNGKFNAYQRTYILQLKNDVNGVEMRYIFAFFNLYIEELRRKSIGGIIKYIKLGDLTNALLPLPDITTQLSIVSELDKINELIRLKKEQLKDYDNLAQSIFYEMFGDPVENDKGWELKKLGEVCSVGTGSTPNRKNKEYYEHGIYPWVKSTEVCNLPIYSVEEFITEEALQNTNCGLYPKDSILMAMYGQGKTRGQVGLLKIEACTNQAVAAIVPSKKINSIFLYRHLMLMYEHIRDMARGGNQANLNLTIVRSIQILLPPLPLQHLFAQRIEQIERQKSAVQKSITDLETLLASRMQYWFE